MPLVRCRPAKHVQGLDEGLSGRGVIPHVHVGTAQAPPAHRLALLVSGRGVEVQGLLVQVQGLLVIFAVAGHIPQVGQGQGQK